MANDLALLAVGSGLAYVPSEDGWLPTPGGDLEGGMTNVRKN